MIRVLHLFLIAAVATTLVACGGGTGTTDTTSNAGSNTAGHGTVGILLTDKPADPSLFVSINASIESIELIGGNDSRVTLYSGQTKTFDLLRLRNESIPFTFQDDVPSGSYCKIRLTLSDLELVLADNTPDDLSDNQTHHPNLPGNGKLDLVARNCFDVAAGEVVTVQLDIDAGNSIHVNENNSGFNFRPVVFVDVLNQDLQPKLVRLQGTITEVDESANTLLVCRAVPVVRVDSMRCVEVMLGEDSAFFDNVSYSGAPRALSELFETDKIDQTVQIVGWPQHIVRPYLHADVPDGHLPPPGECKLWDVTLEPGQQPAPISCDQVPAELPENTVVVTHDGVERDPHHPLMVLDALVVELGEFLTVEGEVATDADVDGFSMSVNTGGPVITRETLAVMFQSGGAGINGTRLVSKSGQLLTSTDVIVPLPVQVDGTLQLVTNSDPLLNAALVIVDTDDLGDEHEQLTGTVLSLGLDTLSLSPDNDTVCGQVSDPVDVSLIQPLDMLTVTITELSSEVMPGGQLEIGRSIGMNAQCIAGGLQTDNVVIVDDQRP